MSMNLTFQNLSIVFFVSNVFWESLKLIKNFCEVKKISGAKTDLKVGFSGSGSIKKIFIQNFWTISEGVKNPIFKGIPEIFLEVKENF